MTCFKMFHKILVGKLITNLNFILQHSNLDPTKISKGF